MQMFSFGRSLEKTVLGFVLVVLTLGFALSGTSLGGFSPLTGESQVKIGSRKYAPEFFLAFKRMISLEGTLGCALNDRVISKDFFIPGIADSLFKMDKKTIYEEMTGNLEKEKRWRPYKNPVFNDISLEGIWKSSSPNLSDSLDRFRVVSSSIEDLSTPSEEFFRCKSNLYIAQSMFTDEDFRSLLRSQIKYETDAEALMTHLNEHNLHFFGYITTEEWFGKKFVDLVARCLLRGAEAARNQGLEVSLEESKADLWARASQMADRFTDEERKVEAKGIFQSFSTFSGLSHAKLIELWREVLLFRKLTTQYTSSLVLDNTIFQQIGKFATEGNRVVRYAIEPGIFLRATDQQFLFNLYCSKIDPDWFHHDSLPKQFLSVEDVKKSYPELIGFRCKGKHRILRQDALTQVSPLKELWTWQVSDDHWDFVLEKEPKLHKVYGSRLDRLFALDERDKIQLDLLCLAEMVREDPDMVRQFLKDCDDDQSRDLQLGLFHPESPFSFLEIESRKEFFALIDRALQGDEEARERLQFFTPDGVNFIRFDPEERGSDYILTFTQARMGGGLEEIKDHELTAYMKKHRIKSIEKAELSYWKNVFKDVPSEDVYEKHRRHFNYLREVRALLQIGDRHLVFDNKNEVSVSPFDKQWLLITLEKDILKSQEKVYYELPTFFEEGSKWSEPVASIAGWLLFDELIEVLPGGLSEAESMQNAALELRSILISRVSSSLLSDWLHQELAERGPLIEEDLNEETA
ncbi:hypothetical protein [Candidatus Similichlamydia epinepheli]|uniref:hypothetical protein n=1 Tax=Candidatus Similichlamydia epinepheli TaxID=1903953 RepID=UPI00130047FC|nr:hypothetical protein [Candidatus Similichlamydia epinepheli]